MTHSPRQTFGSRFHAHQLVIPALLAMSVACARQPEPPPPPPPPPPPLPALVSCGEVRARLDASGPVQIVDTRPSTEFDAGRIAEALTLPIELITLEPGAELSSATRGRLSGLLESAGIKNTGDIVAVDDGTPAGFGRAAFLCWTIALTGYERCSVLTGGIASWRTAGFPIDATVGRTRPPAGTLEPIPEQPAPLANLAAVRAATVAAEPALIDVRSLGDGPGIPGSTQFPLASLFLPGGSIDRIRLDSAATNGGLFGESELIVVGSGPTDGAAGWFALTRVLGIDKVRLYPEGLSGWRQHPELPGNAALTADTKAPTTGVAAPRQP